MHRLAALVLLCHLLPTASTGQDGLEGRDSVKPFLTPPPGGGSVTPLRQGASAPVVKTPFFASLPETFTPKADDPLEAALLEAAVARGTLSWHDVSREQTIAGRKHMVTVAVSNALQVDGVRINLRYDFAQRLADRLGVLLPTPAVANMVQKRATVRFPPQSGPMQEDVKAGKNTTVTAMIKHSRLVDAQVIGRSGLANNEGKWFVLTKQFWWAEGGRQRSGIYGWWRDDGSVIQAYYLAHELPFADYSQVVRFMSAKTRYSVEGGPVQERPTGEILTSKDLAKLLSDEGPLPDVRHPGVPR